MSEIPGFLDVNEVSKLLDIRYEDVLVLVRQKLIESVKVGTNYLCVEKSVRDWEDRHPFKEVEE